MAADMILCGQLPSCISCRPPVTSRDSFFSLSVPLSVVPILELSVTVSVDFAWSWVYMAIRYIEGSSSNIAYAEAGSRLSNLDY